MRLEYRIGGQKDSTPLRVWQITSSEGFNALGEDEPRLHAHGDTGEEYQGTADDLCRSLCHLIDEASRTFRNSGDNRVPRRVTWALSLLDGDSRTLATKGIDWKRKEPIPDPDQQDEDEDEPGRIVGRPADDREILLALLDRQQARITELESLHATNIGLLTSAMGQLTEQSTRLMDSHTSNALGLAQGVVTTVGEHFELWRARAIMELEGAEDEDFLSTPMGQVIADHIPELLKQAPDVLAAFAQWLMSVAETKAGV